MGSSGSYPSASLSSLSIFSSAFIGIFFFLLSTLAEVETAAPVLVRKSFIVSLLRNFLGVCFFFSVESGAGFSCAETISISSAGASGDAGATGRRPARGARRAEARGQGRARRASQSDGASGRQGRAPEGRDRDRQECEFGRVQKLVRHGRGRVGRSI